MNSPRHRRPQSEARADTARPADGPAGAAAEEPMTAIRLARATVIVCLFAAAVEVALGCASTAGLAPADAIVGLFVVGPYLLLASLAWRLRARMMASRAMLAVAIGLAAWGLATFGWHGYRYHAEPEYRALQNMALFAVPLLQWVAVFLVGLASLLVRPGSREEFAR